MNTSYPHGGHPFRPQHPGGGGDTPTWPGITEQSVRQFEKQLELEWNQIRDIPQLVEDVSGFSAGIGIHAADYAKAHGGWGAGNDLEIIQDAVDVACSSVSQVISTFGRLPVVFLPQGEFDIYGTILVTKPVVIVGRGLTATVLRARANAPTLVFAVDKSDSGINYLDEVNAPGGRHFSVVGSPDPTHTLQDGIRTEAVEGTRAWTSLEQVGLVNCRGRGFYSDTAVTTRVHRCYLFGNYSDGMFLEGDFNTDVRVTESIIRRNKRGAHIAISDGYSLWLSGNLIEQNDRGTGPAGSSTRPCVGIEFAEGRPFKNGWILNNYFEGHLNDVRGTNTVRGLVIRNNYNAVTAKLRTVLSYGTPELQLGAYHFLGSSNDSITIADNMIPHPIRKPSDVSDEEWGTFNSRATYTGTIAPGSNVLVLANQPTFAVGDMLSIAGIEGHFTVQEVDRRYRPDDSYRIVLDRNAPAPATDAAVTLHWGRQWEGVPRLHGRSHKVVDNWYQDHEETGRFASTEAWPRGWGVLQGGFGGTEASSVWRFSGPMTYDLEFGNRVNIRANALELTSKRAQIASENVDVGLIGESRLGASSRNSVVRGERTFMLASDESEVHGNESGVVGSYQSYSDHNRSIVLSSRNTRTAAGARIVAGYGAEGPAHQANRKWEVDVVGGHIRAAGSITGSAVFTDYGEFFENRDLGKIPLGTIVTLEGDRVKPAQSGDRILGVVSATALVIGGDSPFTWSGRYLSGEFGEPLYDEVYDEELGETIKVYRENPEYDPSKPQVPRSERPDEWTLVGLLGQVHVRVTADATAGRFIGADGAPADQDTPLFVMRVTQPFDPEKGYAVARCALRIL